jgi:hypothetical protein
VTVIPTGFAQSNLVFGGSSMPRGAEVTLGHSLSGYAGDATQAAEDIGTAFDTEVMGVLTNTTTLISCRVKFGPDATGPSAEFPIGSTGGGSNPGVSPAVSWLVHKVTAFGGRAGRGRMYVPGLQESSVSVAGVIDGGSVTAMQSAMSAYLLALGVLNLDPVVLHSVGSPLVTPSSITAFNVDSTVATQRRRQRG